MLKVNKVLVIGATGTVGKTVCGIFASFGNATVYMMGRDKEKLKKARHNAALSVKSITVEDNLIIKTMDELDDCIMDADFIFESVSEDMSTKKDIHSRINKSIGKDTIVATGTSGLSIDELAECYDEYKRENFIGVHFFNPPYSMPLCEIIPSKYNKEELINNLKEYLDNILFRDTIVVKNEPAFLANRIGFMFMNEALQYAEKYKEYGGIDYIDSILGCYTGRNMKPLETVDFVGLDVHKSIVDNVRENSKEKDKDSFICPKFVEDLIKSGKLGIKTKEGLYNTEDNVKMVYDINTKEYREAINYSFYFSESAINQIKVGNYEEGFDLIKDDPSLESDICITFLLKYIVYAIQITKTICDDISYCDSAMANGFNWLPPLAMIDALGGKKEVIRLCQKYLDLDPTDLLENVPKSRFDYRKFIKAKV